MGAGTIVRNKGLSIYSRYYDYQDPERLLVVGDSSPSINRVDIDSDDNWKQLALERLSADGSVTLFCLQTNRFKMSKAIQFFATNSIESEYLQLYARLGNLRIIENNLEVELEIPEILH